MDIEVSLELPSAGEMNRLTWEVIHRHSIPNEIVYAIVSAKDRGEFEVHLPFRDYSKAQKCAIVKQLFSKGYVDEATMLAGAQFKDLPSLHLKWGDSNKSYYD